MGSIYVGMGGWSYKPWRVTFYPQEVKSKQELEYASRRVTAIEINSTFYRLQKPEIFAKWREATPAEFVFCVKAPRFVTHRKKLAEGNDGALRFLNSGVGELKEKLGAILWQLAPTQVFSADDIDAFLAALPTALGTKPLRHALNVRHDSFKCAEFIDIARDRNVAVVFEDDEHHPAIADVTANFVYARLRRSVATEPTGYSKPALKIWASRVRMWADGKETRDLPHVVVAKTSERSRDVFVFFINGAKERAPAAACHLIANLNSIRD